MLTNQSARLGPQLKHGQSWRVVDIERSSLQIVDALVKPIPLIAAQLAIEDLGTLNLTGIGDQAIHQLHVRHFKREESHRHPHISSDILGHRERERGLTHRRAPGNDDKVGSLPAAGDVVELVITRRDTRQSVGIGSRRLNHLHGLHQHWVDDRIVFLHVALREFEERTFSLLHQFLHIDGLIESLGLDDACKGYQLAGKRLLGHDVGMILDIG